MVRMQQFDALGGGSDFETARAHKMQESLRGKFLRITIPLIFLSVIAVFGVIELMTHRNAIQRTEQAFEAMVRTQAAAMPLPLVQVGVVCSEAKRRQGLVQSMRFRMVSGGVATALSMTRAAIRTTPSVLRRL